MLRDDRVDSTGLYWSHVMTEHWTQIALRDYSLEHWTLLELHDDRVEILGLYWRYMTTELRSLDSAGAT